MFLNIEGKELRGGDDEETVVLKESTHGFVPGSEFLESGKLTD